MSKNNQKNLSGTGLAVSTAPVWESMTNFNGTSILSSGVTNYLNSYNTSQVMRVKYGTAYLVTLRGMLFKQGGFVVGRWRDCPHAPCWMETHGRADLVCGDWTRGDEGQVRCAH